MKKILVTTILGLAVTVSVQAQTAIQLYSYGTPSAGSITYGNTGIGISGGYTVGFYYGQGDTTAFVNAITGGATFPGGAFAGSMVGSGLTLATGPGATAPLGSVDDGPGTYSTFQSYVINPTPSAPTTTITVVLVAYNGASYETSTLRGHSAAFTMPARGLPQLPELTGIYAGAFAIYIPEPSTFALTGLGLVGPLMFRRRV